MVYTPRYLDICITHTYSIRSFDYVGYWSGDTRPTKYIQTRSVMRLLIPLKKSDVNFNVRVYVFTLYAFISDGDLYSR